MWKDFGPLGENHAIQIHDPPSGRHHPLQARPQHFGRITPPIGRIGVGKKFADIAQSGRSKQGVGDGVQEHIGIAVAQRLPIMGDGDSPQHKAGPRPQPMGVVP